MYFCCLGEVVVLYFVICFEYVVLEEDVVEFVEVGVVVCCYVVVGVD